MIAKIEYAEGLEKRTREVGCKNCNLEATMECDNMSCSEYVKFGGGKKCSSIQK